MRVNLYRISGIFGILLLITSCAQIGTLGGGKRDVSPPRLVEAIPANRSLEFHSREVTLTFDEFIKLTGLNEQLIITPKIEKAPEITAEGKKIKIRFQEELLMPGTTYRIYFGSAIADMHESNVLKDFEYVFSTSSFIDSLKIKGTVTDAFDNKVVGGALVGLYSNPRGKDSLPCKNTPDYVTRTDENGNYTFNYLPSGTFDIYTFTDKNKNSLYDGDVEKVGFFGPPLMLPGDTVVDIKLFQEESPKTYIKKSSSPYLGLAQVILNKKAKVTVNALDKQQNGNLYESLKGTEKDTISVYYKNCKDTLGLLIGNSATGKTDTLKIVIPSTRNKGRKLKNYAITATGGKLGFGESLKINFPVWMDTLKFDRTKIKFSRKKDSLAIKEEIIGRWLGITSYQINNKLIEGAAYTLILDTNSFFDINGNGVDSNRFEFKTQTKSELGKLTLKLKVNRKQKYIVQLINDQQKVYRERLLSFSLSSSNAVNIDFIDVLPGSYTFKVMSDNNENNKWDAGDLTIKKLPEQVFINPKQIKVLADWEVEEEILVKE